MRRPGRPEAASVMATQSRYPDLAFSNLWYSPGTVTPKESACFQSVPTRATRSPSMPTGGRLRRHRRANEAGKTRELLSECDDETRRILAEPKKRCQIITASAAQTPTIESSCVQLVVTLPPFLDVVDYASDNWLRSWFIGLDSRSVKLTVTKSLGEWQRAMSDAFREIHRVLRPGGFVAFEVGEIRRGKLKLEEAVLACGVAAGLQPQFVLIHDQHFTKTSHCWGKTTMSKGQIPTASSSFRSRSESAGATSRKS